MITQYTYLWHIAEDGKRRLMQTITAGSQFFGFKTPTEMFRPSQRELAAITIRDGWINQGGMRNGSWEIEHSNRRLF